MIFTLNNRGYDPLRRSLFSFNKIQTNRAAIRSTTQPRNVHPDHRLIYKFPLVRVASLINRLKLYQTLATVTAIPAVTILAACEEMSFKTALLLVSSGISWCLSLSAIGYIGVDRVGFIHLRNDRKSVKISYADFWGRRVVIDVPIEDIWPLGDLPNTNPLYYSLRRYSTKKTLKFSMKNGIVEDPDLFKFVFGQIVEDKKL